MRKVLEGGWSRIGVVGVICVGLFFFNVWWRTQYISRHDALGGIYFSDARP